MACSKLDRWRHTPGFDMFCVSTAETGRLQEEAEPGGGTEQGSAGKT